MVTLSLFSSSCTTTPNPEGGAGLETSESIHAVSPLPFVHGTIRMVNEDLKFIVFDFALDQFPSHGQFLGVYRGDEKVGEVRVSGPTQQTYTAADIVSGDIRVGDKVRAQ